MYINGTLLRKCANLLENYFFSSNQNFEGSFYTHHINTLFLLNSDCIRWLVALKKNDMGLSQNFANLSELMKFYRP